MLGIETVAVLGATEGGTACAVLAALAGCAVRLHDPEGARAAPDVLRRAVERAFTRGSITRAERQAVLDGVLFTSDLDEALTAADLVVDALAGPSPSAASFGEALRATTAVAAAGISTAADLAATLPQPGRVLGLRLAPSGGPLPLLEAAPAAATSAHVLERVRAFAARVNRAARVAAEAP
jgi:3-hydroxybutyryl-CoA dehydrogenase